MKEVLNEIIVIIVPIIGTIISGVITYLGTKIKNNLEEKHQNELIDKIINSTVKYINQVYDNLKNEEKLNKAKEISTTRLNNKGISLDEIELTILIESFVGDEKWLN